MEKKKEPWVHYMATFICGVIVGALANVPTYLEVGIQIVFVGVMAALCTFFLEFCYRPGNIFGWYMDWMDRNLRDNVKNPFRILYKPLGGCAYCQNTWIAIAFHSVLAVYFGLSWWLILPSIFMAHLFLTILDDLFWS